MHWEGGNLTGVKTLRGMNLVGDNGKKNEKNLGRNQLKSEASPEIFGRQISPIDSSLEYHDPTPNIQDLFASFNKQFFWSKLEAVEVKWSNRMTASAGVCTYLENKNYCSIRLSAPLLILRPRKDLVETLLHEMIHAYLFVTKNFKDREEHGPEFHSHMERINKEAGTNITVFHDFYYEVAFYQTHIWRCNGPCRNRQPLFGFVKRAINRVPGPNDVWWLSHSMYCGGTFEKISEPEKRGKKKNGSTTGKENNLIKINDIRDFFRSNKSKSSTTTRGGTTQSTSTTTNAEFNNPTRGNNQNGENVLGRDNVNTPKPGTSRSFGNNGGNQQKNITGTVQNVWADKCTPTYETNKKRNSSTPIEVIDLSTEPKKKQLICPVCFMSVGETEINEHLDKCLMEEDNSVEIIYEELVIQDEEEPDDGVLILCPLCGQSLQGNKLDEHLEDCFRLRVKKNETDADDEEDTDNVPCPCCLKWVKEKEINKHIDECLTFITLKGSETKY